MLLPLMAQNNTNSPYTRFGYGDLGERSFGAGRAMGGVGYGLRSPKQINPMNPASYSCMDSLTFLFDFGVAGQLSWLMTEMPVRTISTETWNILQCSFRFIAG